MHHEGRDPHDLAALGVRPVAGAAALEAAARDVVGITVAEELFGYIWALADQTRRSPSLALGVSPRGAAMLLSVAKAWAYLSGRTFVTPDDVKALVKPAWRHRVVLRPEVEMEGATTDAVLDGVVERVPVPK
jgi:MoxR-like ATPase